MKTNFLILTCFSLSYRYLDAEVKLVDNGYEGIILTIADHVKQDTALLVKIQDWLTDSSRKLYIASKRHVFLKEVTIRVPDHWNNTGQYNLTSVSTTGKGDIYLEDHQPGAISNPFTYGLPGCGLKGKYIRFTTKLLRQGASSSFGNLENVFIHEWGHFRWGLMDEYPTSKDIFGKIIRFYMYNGNWEAVRCTTQIKGINRNKYTGTSCNLDNTRLPEPDCYFFPIVTSGGQSAPVASIMGDAYIPTLSHFCDNTATDDALRHNDLAPNNQNDRCGGKSSWEVMRENDDFKGRSPGSPDQDTTPRFYLEQLKVQGRFCFLIDVSGSMSGYIIKARDAVATVISNVLPNGSYAGVVIFSSSASISKEMTEILSENDRTELVRSLPTTAYGSTGIGAGLQMCMKALSQLSDIRGSKIYLATDGQENSSPYIADVMPDVISNQIIIDTLAIGNSADSKLRQVALDTGGSSYFFSTSSQNSTALLDALVEPFTFATKDPSVRLMSEHIEKTAADEGVEKMFYIDESIGRETIVQLTSENLNNVNLTVKGPNLTQSIIGTSSDTAVITVKIPGKTQAGEYSVTLSSVSSAISGTLSILSKAATQGEAILETSVIETPSALNYSSDLHIPLYVTIYKGTSPVSKASVIAYIENPEGETTAIKLKDNAVGADILANDGIYSAYILPQHITSSGRHSVKVIVFGQNSSIIVPSAQAPGKDFEGQQVTEQEIGSFMRVALSNEILVNGYSPSYSTVDTIPPSPILTLVLAETSSNNSFTLLWRAVGDDYDSGKASEYDVRLSTDLIELKTNPNNQTNLIVAMEAKEPGEEERTNLTVAMEPKEPGEEERYNFTLENIQSNTTYFICVRAVDEAGNIGDISNIVTVSVLTDQSWTRQYSPPPEKEDGRKISTIFIAGIAAGSVIIALMFFLWLVHLINSRRSSIPRLA